MALFDSLMAAFSSAAALRRGVRQFERGDPKGAFVLLSRAARSGVPEAEFRVGRCYLEGAGVPPSRADGVRWVERAAAKRYVEAQALLATLCLHGMGPGFADAGPNAGAGLFGGQTMAEPDYASAAKWARRAAEGGSAEGQAVLGFILTSGPESFRNLSEATVGTRNPRPAAARKDSSATHSFWHATPPPPKPRRSCSGISVRPRKRGWRPRSISMAWSRSAA